MLRLWQRSQCKRNDMLVIAKETWTCKTSTAYRSSKKFKNEQGFNISILLRIGIRAVSQPCKKGINLLNIVYSNGPDHLKNYLNTGASKFKITNSFTYKFWQ